MPKLLPITLSSLEDGLRPLQNCAQPCIDELKAKLATGISITDEECLQFPFRQWEGNCWMHPSWTQYQLELKAWACSISQWLKELALKTPRFSKIYSPCLHERWKWSWSSLDARPTTKSNCCFVIVHLIPTSRRHRNTYIHSLFNLMYSSKCESFKIFLSLATKHCKSFGL